MAFTLASTSRTGQAAELRADSQLPAVVYGPDIQSISIAVPHQAFVKLYAEAGESTLVDLAVDAKEPIKVLIQDIQYDPVTGRVIHVDFRQINMKKELTAKVELKFVGESVAVKEAGGTLIKGLESIEVRCLPKDLVGSIDVDLSILKGFDDVIHVGDLPLSAGITVVGDLQTVVAKVKAPLTEEQLKAMEEAVAPVKLEEIELSEKKGKKEEEGVATEAGAAAPEAKADEKSQAKKE